MALLAPPSGRLTAVNVNTGDIPWRIPFGITDGVPAGLETGGVNSGAGPITTAGGLIFIGADRARHFRAYETKTGYFRPPYLHGQER